MEFTVMTELLEAIRTHNRETGHEILEADNPRERTLGYSCAECDTSWEISLTAAVNSGLYDLPLPRRSAQMLASLNEHTRDRFFEGARLPDDDVLFSVMEDPEADDIKWAIQHINMPVQKRRG